MTEQILLVGRAGVEPTTNGLKVRCALPAQSGFPLCAVGIARPKVPFLPALCQKSPT